MSAAMTMGGRSKAEEGRALLSRALDGYLDANTRAAFDDMLRRIADPDSKNRTLTTAQEKWVRYVVADQEAHPERKPNNVGETPAVLLNLPKKPPGRK